MKDLDMIASKREGESKKNKILPWIFCLCFLARNSAAEESKQEFSLLANQSLKLNGFTQVEYTHSEESTDGFRIRGVRFILRGEILRNLHYKVHIDAIKSPVLLDAQVEIQFYSQVKLRFGQFKVPFSLENLTSFYALDTINRSLTVERLCPGRDIRAAGRDIGITLNGRFSWLECVFGIFNGSGINQADSNERKDISGRLIFHPSDVLSLGLSHYNGGYSPSEGGQVLKRNRTGLEISCVQNRFSLKGEYISARDEDDQRRGWYVQGGYYLIPEKIQTILKYDFFDENSEVQGDRAEVTTLGLTWFFSQKTKLLINYVHHREEGNESSKNAVYLQFQAGF